MTQAVTVRLAEKPEKSLVAAILKSYLAELAGFSTLKSLGEQTESYPYLDDYWRESERQPYLILSDDEVIGFALVRCIESTHYEMAEFSVITSRRRNGVGQVAAMEIFSKLGGDWRIEWLITNKPAKAFWESVTRPMNPTAIKARDGYQGIKLSIR